jgi:hypothetical protein
LEYEDGVLSNMKKQLLFNGKKGKVTRSSLLTFTDLQYRDILLRAKKERSNAKVEEGIAIALPICKHLASPLLDVSFIFGTTS